jgi:hypothetical protein
MKQEALRVMELLTRASAKKEDRLTELLRDPENDGTTGWFMHLPTCFNDALDIKQTPRKVDGKTVTVWTQGAGFAFKAGDTIYDTARAYDEWAQALRHIRLCVQVRSASDATSPQASAARNLGNVVFDVLVPSNDGTVLVHSASHALTQDAFVRFLISGDGLPR